MSMTKELVETLRELQEVCNQLTDTIADLSATLAKNHADESEQELEPAKRDVKADKELIRQKLAEKAAAGKTKEVRDLLHQFKAQKLSDVDPKDYEELYYSIEALDHA
ncbi:MAG: hypothetical protein ACI31N_04885 [Lacticaseibacillus absianus]